MRKLAILLVSAGLTLMGANAAATIHEIQVGNFFFTPLGTTIQHGDTVRWVFVGGTHTTTSRPSSAKSWDSGFLSSGSFDVVFTAADGPGPFPYRCELHPVSMVDTIFVEPSAPTEPTIFTFRIDQAQADAGNGTGSDAFGYGLAVLSPDSTSLSFRIYHSVPSPIDAHVHLGAPGVSGGIEFPFTSPTSPIIETWNVTATDVANLLNGELYVNIHTNANPGGEIRGQIDQEPLRFAFTLDEAQADAGNGTGSFGAGFGVCELNAASTELSLDVTHDVTTANDGHVHLGEPGVSGAIQFGFTDPGSPINESWQLDTLDIDNLIAGRLYVNIHTPDNPGGEIRGQIVNPELVLTTRMDGTQADAGNGTGSDATGFGVFILHPDRTRMSMVVEHDVQNVNDGHIHLGAPGVSGPIQFGFSSPTSPILETWDITTDDYANLLAGDLYVNIHSSDFPGGEIRGQIVPSAEMGVNLTLDEAQANECAGTGSAATGNATVTLKPGGREMTITVSHDVTNAIDGHIHLGDTCVAGPIQFGFTSPASPIEEIWYLDDTSVVDLMQGTLYVNIHSMAFPSGEIRGQLVNSGGCCTGIAGNADADPDDIVDVGDLTALIGFLFLNASDLACPAEGNVDGDPDGIVDVGDLTALIGFLFLGGDQPADCQ